MDRDRQIGWQTVKQIRRLADRQTVGWQRDRHASWQSDRQVGWQTVRQTRKLADNETGGLADSETDT